jgi:hypothetical protein
MREKALRGRSVLARPHESWTTANIAAMKCECAVRQQRMD